jgi:hypothetical protein
MRSVLASVVLMFLVVNMGVVYYMLFFGDLSDQNKKVALLEKRVDSLIKRDGQVPLATIKPVDTTNQLTDEQMDIIADKVIEKMGNKFSGAITGKITTKPEPTTSTNLTSTIYIPLGGGSVQTDNYTWKDVPVEVDINTDDYPKILEMRFYGTLKVPTGNGRVEARLYDVSSGQITGSEIGGEGAGGVYVGSNTFRLGSGVRKLRLQMRTSMDYQGVLENGKIKIIWTN